MASMMISLTQIEKTKGYFLVNMSNETVMSGKGDTLFICLHIGTWRTIWNKND